MKPSTPRRKKRVRDNKPKVCRLCEAHVNYIDFKDGEFLRKFQTEKGRILSRRLTGNCPQHQKLLAEAIKRARIISVVL